MITQIKPKTYTITEYLELEDQADIRNEYINGEIIPMTGGTTNHNLITGNLYLALRLALKGKNQPVFIENVRLFIAFNNIFTYPDVMVMANEPEYYQETKTTVTNPLIIIEVLSPATRDYDLGQKFEYYRTLDSLQEYILVDPEKTMIMAYLRDNNQRWLQRWLLNIYENLNDILHLKSVSLDIPLTDIYEGVFN